MHSKDTASEAGERKASHLLGLLPRQPELRQELHPKSPAWVVGPQALGPSSVVAFPGMLVGS